MSTKSTQPTDKDVIPYSKKHPGNIYFEECIVARARDYARAKSLNKKREIVDSILDLIHEAGGRFLIKEVVSTPTLSNADGAYADSGTRAFVQMSDEQAFKKVMREIKKVSVEVVRKEEKQKKKMADDGTEKNEVELINSKKKRRLLQKIKDIKRSNGFSRGRMVYLERKLKRRFPNKNRSYNGGIATSFMSVSNTAFYLLPRRYLNQYHRSYYHCNQGNMSSRWMFVQGEICKSTLCQMLMTRTNNNNSHVTPESNLMDAQRRLLYALYQTPYLFALYDRYSPPQKSMNGLIVEKVSHIYVFQIDIVYITTAFLLNIIKHSRNNDSQQWNVDKQGGRGVNFHAKATEYLELKRVLTNIVKSIACQDIFRKKSINYNKYVAVLHLYAAEHGPLAFMEENEKNHWNIQDFAYSNSDIQLQAFDRLKLVDIQIEIVTTLIGNLEDEDMQKFLKNKVLDGLFVTSPIAFVQQFFDEFLKDDDELDSASSIMSVLDELIRLTSSLELNEEGDNLMKINDEGTGCYFHLIPLALKMGYCALAHHNHLNYNADYRMEDVEDVLDDFLSVEIYYFSSHVFLRRNFVSSLKNWKFFTDAYMDYLVDSGILLDESSILFHCYPSRANKNSESSSSTSYHLARDLINEIESGQSDTVWMELFRVIYDMILSNSDEAIKKLRLDTSHWHYMFFFAPSDCVAVDTINDKVLDEIERGLSSAPSNNGYNNHCPTELSSVKVAKVLVCNELFGPFHPYIVKSILTDMALLNTAFDTVIKGFSLYKSRGIDVYLIYKLVKKLRELDSKTQIESFEQEAAAKYQEVIRCLIFEEKLRVVPNYTSSKNILPSLRVNKITSDLIQEIKFNF